MDARISDVMVTLDQRWGNRMDDAMDQLKKAGLESAAPIDDQALVEGTIEVSKAPALEKLDCVDYVRTVFTYWADYPVGDPRDKNGE